MDPGRIMRHACEYTLNTQNYAALVGLLIMCKDNYPDLLEVYAPKLAFDIFQWDVRTVTNTSILRTRKWSCLVAAIANRFAEVNRCQQCGQNGRAIMWSAPIRLFLQLPIRCCVDCAQSTSFSIPVTVHHHQMTSNAVTFHCTEPITTPGPFMMTRYRAFHQIMANVSDVYAAGLSLDEMVDSHGALYKYQADTCQDTMYFYRSWIDQVLRFKSMGLRLQRLWVAAAAPEQI
jgi:hypothetical protein